MVLHSNSVEQNHSTPEFWLIETTQKDSFGQRTARPRTKSVRMLKFHLILVFGSSRLVLYSSVIVVQHSGAGTFASVRDWVSWTQWLLSCIGAVQHFSVICSQYMLT